MKLTNYVSEFTCFIENMKKENPLIEQGQQYGHSLLWNKEPIQIREKIIDQISKEDQLPILYHKVPDNNY